MNRTHIRLTIGKNIRPKSHWLNDFMFGFLAGTTAFFSFLGWILVCFGWMSVPGALFTCAAIGLLFGARLACENMKEK